ncbi:MAG: ABC transporter permease [Cyclobacteriaceae bacterium]|nr:ABC transporter permease [Cyclobacteriaceae bacterium]
MRRNSPPRFALWFLRWYCHPKLLPYIEGDLLEFYTERSKSSGQRIADLRFIIDVLLLCRPSIIRPAEGHNQLNNYGMLKNYFKVGFRNILKYKVFSFINVFGLAVAMSVCMLIMLMLADQLRYDQFNTKQDRIYRILSDYEGSRQAYATSPFPLADVLRSDYPIIQASTRLTPGIGGDVNVDQRFAEMRGYFAEPEFFTIFSFDLESGDKKTALSSPRTMVITRALANKLFSNENPVGKRVEFADRQLPFPQDFDGVGTAPKPWGSFTITGVLDESRYVSHLKFDVLVSASTRDALVDEKKLGDLSNSWDSYFRTYTFVLLKEEAEEHDLATILKDFATRQYANSTSDLTKGFKLIPQPLSEVALGLTGNDTNNRMPLIGYYFLSALAMVIMLSACLNYTNLSIARSLTRAREIGVRKVTGALRKNLIVQFLSESVITSLLALLLALVLLRILTPAFKGLWINQFLNFELPSVPGVYLAFFVFAVLTGLAAGLYPALHLSRQQPIQALKYKGTEMPGKLGMRKALGILQFVLSLFFITTSIVIYNQFKHFLSFDYGFQTRNIINIELQGVNYKTLSNELRQVPGVMAISACDVIPAGGRSNGNEIRKSGTTDEYFGNDLLQTDEYFMGNLGIRLVAGRNLADNEPAGNILVNEAMVQSLGHHHPSEVIGEVLETKWGNELFTIVGVVTNFSYRLLIDQDKNKPLMVRYAPGSFEYLNVSIRSGDPVSTISNMEKVWKKFDPAHPLKYEFMDEQLKSTHHAIFDVVAILGFISFLAIVIACLGLLGMTTYTAERMTREVGIRKILGAADHSIALLLSRDFLKMLGISILIGAPMSYAITSIWLEEFPNRVEFGPGPLVVGVGILVILGLITIGSQVWSASRRNPVESLKTE